MKIIHYKQAEAKNYSPDMAKGITGRVGIGKADGAKNFCMRIFEVAAGGSSPKHAHGYEHEVFVHAGKGAVYSKGDWVPLKAGTVVFIPPDEEHQIKNVGEEPFVFVCLIPSGFPEI